SVLLMRRRRPGRPLFPYTTLFRSGDALAEIEALGAVVSDVSLFSFVALIDQNGGDVAAARTQFAAQLTGAPGNRQLNQAFVDDLDRKSTRLNSSHVKISYAVFCLK